MPIALGIIDFAAFGNNRICTASTRESSGFRETAELDRNVLGSVNLIDALWQRIIAHKSDIGSVVQNQRLVCVRVLNPRTELRFRHCTSGGIVGKAQIYDI